MIVLLWLACTSTPESVPHKNNQYQTPIFVDMDGQNWRYPLSSIGEEAEITDPELREGNRQYHEGEYKRAAQILIPYIEEHPTDASAHSILSACFFRLGDLNQAMKAAQKSIEHAPSVISYSNLGSILAGQGSIDASIEAYQQANALDPKHFLPIRNLVTLYYRIENLPKAEELLYQLIKIDPTDSYGYVSLGQVLVEQNKWKEAEAIYRFRLEDLDMTPSDERYLAGGLMLDLPLALANVLLHQKRYTEAEKYFHEMLSLTDTVQATWTTPNVYRNKAYIGLVELYMATGQKEKEREIRNAFETLQEQ